MSQKAIDVWKLMNGIICAYKPPESTSAYVLNKMKSNICRDLNQLETRPQRQYLDIDNSVSSGEVILRPSYADNILCSGPRYQPQKLLLDIPLPLSDLSSGVMILSCNGGVMLSKLIKEQLHFTKGYQLNGLLGQATTNYHINEKVIAKASYKHVKKSLVDRYLSSYQSAAHLRMFKEYGIPLTSQEGYNFAVQGLYRPVFKGPPVIYSIKLLEFEPPNFTLEVQCINETEVLLMNLIHDLGLSLRCFATCTGIRCIRQGCFHVEHSLAKNQWNASEIVENIKLCWNVLEKNYPKKVKASSVVKTRSTKDVQSNTRESSTG